MYGGEVKKLRDAAQLELHLPDQHNAPMRFLVCGKLSMLIERFAAIVLVLGLATVASGCGDPADDTIDEPPREVPQREAESEFGHYFLKFAPEQEPIPFNDYFELSVEIYSDAKMTELAEAAELEFDAEVADLGGQLPTAPVIESVSPGTFVIKRLLLHVPRPWELEFEILDDGFEEKARAVVDPTRGFETGTDPSGFFSDDEVKRILNMSPKGGPELPDEPSNAYADDQGAAKLGQFLFFDERLSGNGEVACATCHAPDKGFADGAKLATGIGETPRHAPTVLNAAFNRWQFWDGRTDSLWAQALQPLEAGPEHGTNRLQIVHLVAEDADYHMAYENVFGALADFSDRQRFPAHARPIPNDPDHPENQAWMAMAEQDRTAVTQVYANIGKAIGAYERKLVSLDAPFDEFAQGLREDNATKMEAIDSAAKEGLKLYLGEGQCDLCHSGAMLTNFEFHNLGVGARDWLSEDEGRIAGADQLDREEFSAAGEFSDSTDTLHPSLTFMRRGEFRQTGAFKTPTLRNIARTAPYMHGGQFSSLSEVLQFYADLQEDPPVGRRDELV
jgi:cytochrome c peroxidase